MNVSDMTVNSFWKGEYGVNGLVDDGLSQYQVKLLVKGSKVLDYTCSCADGNSFRGMCRHSQLVWEGFQKRILNQPKKSLRTSMEARAMIREYTNREVELITLEGEQDQISFVPKLILSKEGARLEFKLGRERLYLLRDLQAFVRALEYGSYVEYGKSLAFHHNISLFAEESRDLVLFVVDLVNIYLDYYEQFSRGSRETSVAIRSLKLNRGNLDRFFSLIIGKQLDVEMGTDPGFSVSVADKLPDMVVQIGKMNGDGIRVLIDKEWYSLEGERSLYVGNRSILYCLDDVSSRELKVFVRQMTQEPAGSREILIHEKDIPLFYERVLQKVGAYCSLDIEDGLSLETYKTDELRARFEFDSPYDRAITLQPTLSYGDYFFHPIEDETVPRTICRNVPGEFRISQVITKYFRHRMAETGDLILRDDEDALYELLTRGIPEFRALGEVTFTKAAECMRVSPPSHVHVNVSYDGSWLNLTVDTNDLNEKEFKEILAAYKMKKSYYRKADGGFMQLDDSGLMMVAELLEEFALSPKDIREHNLRLPSCRALYLDRIFKDKSGVTFYRDQLFKALVRGIKSTEDSDFEVPDKLRNVLRGYQKTGFLWLKTLDAYGFGGILADEMGLGKTVQIISLLLDEAAKGGKAVSLVLCPASLVYNWENEIHTFAPSLTVLAVTGTARERQELLTETERPDVYITSYDLLKRDMVLYQSIEFRYQIIDEAQYIKNAGTQIAKVVKSIHSVTRFALTGTPIENRLAELWSIFDFLMPGYLFRYRRFKERYEIPITKEADKTAMERLRMVIAPFVLRRLKKDVLQDLPDKLETVVYSKLEGEQRRLYTAHALQLKEQLESAEPEEYRTGKIRILTELMRLRQLCCDPSLCYANYRGESAKLSTCLELVHRGVEGKHKILLFSQFTSMLEIIRKKLDDSEIACHMLTGETTKEKRLHMVRSFQTDEIFVFLISLKAGGTGLNLTAADIVIHYDPWWNVAAQNQATDRAHRIGQKSQVSVFQLIAKATIEENICRLQKQKKDLAEQILMGESSSLGQLTKEELIKILQ